MKSRTALAALTVVAATAALLSGCSSSDSSTTKAQSTKGQTITVWSEENLPDRVQATKAIIEKFTAKTGIKVKLVGIDQNQFGQLVASSALSGKLPDVVGALALSDVRQLNDQKLLNTDAAAKVIDELGKGTFDSSALALDTDSGKTLGVPDSGFAQILVYRKDLFQKAGLKPPTTYASLEKAAQTLTAKGMYGITLATDPADVFTEQTFESLALGNNCQLVNKSGDIQLQSAACEKTWKLYADLAQKYSPQGTQTVDTTRATYFAGQAAMVDWSTFILDELAGLRNDALPTCPQCQGDPTWLAKNSGIVTNISGPDGGSGGTYGEITSWVVTKNANAAASEKFIQYMMSTGYLDWLGMAPEGKVPVRTGDSSDPQKYTNGWKTLKAGVDTKKPLSDIYDAATIADIEKAPKNIDRWALPQGQGSLLGPVDTQLVIPKVVGELGAGSLNATEAAKQATEQVTQLQAKIK